jgi:predicted MFS family arabinose efflux permease
MTQMSTGELRATRVATIAAPPQLTLFLCMFAGQAGLIALSPVLPDIARTFDVSTATAGQLRSLSGLTAGVSAVAMGAVTTRLGIRDLLIAGLGLLLAGSLVSAAAPAFAVLACAQMVVGAGLAVVLAAAVAGAAEWVPDERRSGALSWTLIGPPMAWIVGLPVVGVVGDVSWRLGLIAVPVTTGLLALLAVVSRCPDAPLQQTERGHAGDRALRRWAVGELLAFSAWAGTVVYVGALLVESYSISVASAGLLLGAGAAAYLPGNFLARRWVDGSARRLLAGLALALAAVVAVFGAVRPHVWVSALLFGVLSFLAGARTFTGSALGLTVAPEHKLLAMRLRAGALQFGYLFGSLLGGVALAAGGYGAVGATFAVLFVLAALPHLHRGPVATAAS